MASLFKAKPVAMARRTYVGKDGPHTEYTMVMQNGEDIFGYWQVDGVPPSPTVEIEINPTRSFEIRRPWVTR